MKNIILIAFCSILLFGCAGKRMEFAESRAAQMSDAKLCYNAGFMTTKKHGENLIHAITMEINKRGINNSKSCLNQMSKGSNNR